LPELAVQLRLPVPAGTAPQLYRSRGCEHCNGAGYRGRIAIMELLTLTDEIRRLVLKRAAIQEIHRTGVDEGMQTMYDDGMLKAMHGITSIEEVLRVTRDL
jgi:general secretion pathway protein E